MASYDEQDSSDIDLSSEFNFFVLWMNDKYSDVTFVVENMKIPAHKMILKARSPYFRALLDGSFAESNQVEINLEVPLEAFKVLLRFVYTGCMALSPLTVKQIIHVYGLADLYQFEALSETIPKYLATKLSMENCFKILNAAEFYSQTHLQADCLKFMDEHSTELLKHETFKLMSSASLCTLLKRDTFSAPEIDIFNAVKKWSVHNPTADLKVNLFLVTNTTSVLQFDAILFHLDATFADSLVIY